VLANLLEQEQLIKEAYKEEIKESIKRFTKNIEASIYVAPLLKSYLETHQHYSYYNNPQRNNNNVLAGSIFVSALFLGSAMMLPYSPNLSYGGFVACAITLIITIMWKKFHF
jgi:hypothetical protein